MRTLALLLGFIPFISHAAECELLQSNEKLQAFMGASSAASQNLDYLVGEIDNCFGSRGKSETKEKLNKIKSDIQNVSNELTTVACADAAQIPAKAQELNPKIESLIDELEKNESAADQLPQKASDMSGFTFCMSNQAQCKTLTYGFSGGSPSKHPNCAADANDNAFNNPQSLALKKLRKEQLRAIADGLKGIAADQSFAAKPASEPNRKPAVEASPTPIVAEQPVKAPEETKPEEPAPQPEKPAEEVHVAETPKEEPKPSEEPKKQEVLQTACGGSVQALTGNATQEKLADEANAVLGSMKTDKQEEAAAESDPAASEKEMSCNYQEAVAIMDGKAIDYWFWRAFCVKDKGSRGRLETRTCERIENAHSRIKELEACKEKWLVKREAHKKPRKHEERNS